jgi:4'-phosphopantetheinyl transferase
MDEGGIRNAELVLSRNERARADQYQDDAIRVRFVTGRAMLRSLLAEHAGLPARDVMIGCTALGRPVLIASGEPALDFSLSYAGPLILLAIGLGVRIGVDIEAMRLIPEADAIVARHFAKSEAKRWSELPLAHRQRAFLEGWTRKEAVLKAAGCGLTCGLGAANVTFGPGIPARVVAAGGVRDHGWRLQDISPVDGYVAALVSNHRLSERLALRRWL